jgi:2-aminoadipate transaminase
MSRPAFADRINDVPRSFLREILKVAISEDVISFAGGLPNRDLFPVDAIRAAADRVFVEEGRSALQYGSSEGYLPLREYIAARYRSRFGLEVDPARVLITSGSQQGLDLVGKTLLNEGDPVAIEEPGYLGAIQAFSVYRAAFRPVPVSPGGADLDALAALLKGDAPRVFYTVPNFQNPSGISYDDANRAAVDELVGAGDTVLIEDDPYGELRFSGADPQPFGARIPEQVVMLGSFSKIVAPSFRVGWLVAGDALMDKLLVAKQATDLHTSEITQRILYRYLADNDVDAHVALIRGKYGAQCRAMVDALRRSFPPEVNIVEPEGGMFLWLELPDGIDAMTLFDEAIRRKVAFVPGLPFYTRPGVGANALRLNFSCVGESAIASGVERLAESLAAVRDRLGV